ncbi:MAG TPA: trehalose-phosphatase [Anaeromyxobacter sp.]|nr:trehalose-phosphatase [Anaeromyxobacter sp.]
MIDVLSDEARPVLDDVARRRMLLAFDFDGTLAPLVDDRDAAGMPDSTRRLLRLVSILYPCAVVSGRSRRDLVRRLDGVPLLAVVGNHGAEAGHGPVDGTVRDLVIGWREAARAALAGVAGVEIEDKGLSLAIHYRRARAREDAARAVAAAARALPGARVFGGHEVVNVVPPDLHDKGLAVAGLVARLSRGEALYVGDDVTDEDAFASPAVAVGIRVGASPSSAAGYFVPSQERVDDLLRALLRARRRLEGLDDRVDALERMLG